MTAQEVALASLAVRERSDPCAGDEDRGDPLSDALALTEACGDAGCVNRAFRFCKRRHDGVGLLQRIARKPWFGGLGDARHEIGLDLFTLRRGLAETGSLKVRSQPSDMAALFLLRARRVQRDESIDTTTPGGKLVFGIVGSLAEFEQAIIKERVRARINAAKARGRIGGRPEELFAEDLRAAKALFADPAFTRDAVAKNLSMAPATLNRYLAKDR